MINGESNKDDNNTKQESMTNTIPIIKVKIPSSRVFLNAFSMLDRYACES